MRIRYAVILMLLVAVTGFAFGIALGASLTPTADMRRFLTSRDWAKTAQAFANVAQIIALLVAGWWSYSLFISQRRDRTRANLIHNLIDLGVDGAHRIVRVVVTVQNIGNVVLAPPKGQVKLYQVMPVVDAIGAHMAAFDANVEDPKESPTACEFPWSRIAKAVFLLGRESMTLEPGESAPFSCDFAIARSIQSLFVRSEVTCGDAETPELHWYNETFHKLDDVSSNAPSFAAVTAGGPVLATEPETA